MRCLYSSHLHLYRLTWRHKCIKHQDPVLNIFLCVFKGYSKNKVHEIKLQNGENAYELGISILQKLL